jgi:hypothetical protein
MKNWRMKTSEGKQREKSLKSLRRQLDEFRVRVIGRVQIKVLKPCYTRLC